MLFTRFLIIASFFIHVSTLAQTVRPDTVRLKSRSDSVAADSVRRKATQDSAAVKAVQKAADQPVAASAPTGLHYKVTADGTFASGNVNRALIQLGASLDWAASPEFRFASTPTFAYGQQNGQLNEREFLTDFRTSYKQQNRFYYLAFGSWEKSNLRKINHRLTGGAGVGFKFVSRKNAYLSITDVLLHEYTDFLINSAEVNDINVLRNSTRIYGEYKWGSGRYSLNHTVFFQPALTQRNLRWNGNLTFQIRLTALVSLQTTVQNSYESLVVPGRKNNDFRWTIGLAIQGQ